MAHDNRTPLHSHAIQRLMWAPPAPTGELLLLVTLMLSNYQSVTLYCKNECIPSTCNVAPHQLHMPYVTPPTHACLPNPPPDGITTTRPNIPHHIAHQEMLHSSLSLPFPMSITCTLNEILSHMLSFTNTFTVITWRSTSCCQYNITLHILQTDLHQCFHHYSHAPTLLLLLKGLYGFIIGITTFHLITQQFYHLLPILTLAFMQHHNKLITHTLQCLHYNITYDSR